VDVEVVGVVDVQAHGEDSLLRERAHVRAAAVGADLVGADPAEERRR